MGVESYPGGALAEIPLVIAANLVMKSARRSLIAFAISESLVAATVPTLINRVSMSAVVLVKNRAN